MFDFVLIPFCAFAGCVLATPILTNRVIRALERHPEVLDSIPGPLLMGWGLHRYIMREDYRRLNDERLNRQIRNYRRLHALAICVWLVFVASILWKAHSG